MKAAAGLLAVGYIVVYVLARRARRRVVVLCPLKGEAVPREIVERLGEPEAAEPFAGAEFSIGLDPAGPGIAASQVGADSFDERVGRLFPVLRFSWGRERWRDELRRGGWKPVMFYLLAVETLHHLRPRTLAVDFRGLRGGKDVDFAMLAYEILCRMRRASEYRDATFVLYFCGARTWRYVKP